MKKLFTLIGCISLIGLTLHLVPIVAGEIDKGSPPEKSAKANYSIGRYVIGSGGVVDIISSNYIHCATAGQSVAGIMSNANHFLLSGFWLPPNIIAGIDANEVSEVIKTFNLDQNYPNPFNPQTIIQYQLPCECFIRIEVFNLLGQCIRTLTDRLQGSGYKKVVWDGRNDQGNLMNSGIYLYSITAFSTEENRNVFFNETKKMLFVK